MNKYLKGELTRDEITNEVTRILPEGTIIALVFSKPPFDTISCSSNTDNAWSITSLRAIADHLEAKGTSLTGPSSGVL